MNNGMVKLSGLWKGKDKDGNTMLTGNLSKISRVVILANTYKKGDQDPDFFLYTAPVQEKKDQKPKARTVDL